MKILIASDIHGSAYYAELVREKFFAEKADKLLLLGDIYNHGPRNPFPKDYAPQTVAEILNALKDKLIVVKGNCDSEVDTLISEFDFIENCCILIGNKTVFCTHGHVYNKDNMPLTRFDALVYGHFHTGFTERINGVLVANAGSVSLPKNGTPHSYILLAGDKLILKTLDGEIIKEETI
ncbi:MAG: phosphodiesterase [Clostridia bacterium]|nr:phosphodiesterase [Clostridia bacterium]